MPTQVRAVPKRRITLFFPLGLRYPSSDIAESKKMDSSLPLTRDLVFIGGGHAHALVLRKWGMNPLPGVQVTLINPGPTAPYTGMLPGYIAGHYPRHALEIDLVKLARFAGARLVLGAASGIDRAAQTVQVPGHPDLRYDAVSIDVGITSDMPRLPGFAEHGIAAKPLGDFARAWETFAATTTGQVDLCVIGAGVAGVELALAMHHRLAGKGAPPRVTIVDRGEALAGLSPPARMVLFERLRAADIRVLGNVAVQHVTATGVHLEDGRILASDFTLGAAGARPHDWLGDLGLEQESGYLNVNKYLQTTSDPKVYAVGDCAHMGFAPRPKAGVYAVRQAPVLFDNLRADMAGGRLRAFAPQKDFLKLISLGARSATADVYGTGPTGAWLWRLKDHIDRTFMDKFTTLPAMPMPKLPAAHAKGMERAIGVTPPCGGCGSKVGGDVLAKTLADLPAPARADVASRPGDDAAILRHGAGWQVMTTDHLRAFTLDPVTQTRITAIHALGDIWAMGAAPQAVTATVILPRMVDALQAAMLSEIMQTASAVFRAEGADLVGGHSSIGAELTVGFTITGLSDTAPVTVGGALPGDVVIVTKPIGSGTLLAGEMQMRANGADVAAAYSLMAQSQSKAARILSKAHAMTDVTGFGLAGHLWNICQTSGVAATITLSDVPVMNGALDLANSGLRSSLFAANRAALAGVVQSSLAQDARADLLFDPQTAGGLLACVAPQEADACLAALKAAGYQAARVGVLQSAPPGISIS
jgi:selenide,water dikinase